MSSKSTTANIFPPARKLSKVSDEVQYDAINHWIGKGKQRICASCQKTTLYFCEKRNVGLHPDCHKQFQAVLLSQKVFHVSFLYDNLPSDCQIIIYLITTLFQISYLQTFVLAVFSRSRCSQMLFKVGDLKSFLNFTGKHLRWSLFFNKVGGLQGLQLYKKETPTQVFSCHM